ncbi:MAG: ribokinase [Clostridia bacterium]|nr:ribokinase [Clostridia bacterium]
MKNIFILGSINTDLVINAPYMPVSGETLTGGAFNIAFGGKGANQAVAAAKLGGKVFMAGAVGDDDFGVQMLNNLKNVGVNVDAVRVINGVNSGVAVITVIDGDNRIILSRGANGLVSNDDADNLLKNAKAGDIFVTQLEIPIPVVGYALKKAKSIGMLTVLNPAPAQKEVAPYISDAMIITPNESELAILTGEEDIVKGASKLPCDKVIVTLGGKGYYYKDDKQDFFGKAIKIKPVDTTAAGDTFLGALCYKISLGKAPSDALKFASKCASIACLKQGAQPSIPTLEEVDAFEEVY